MDIKVYRKALDNIERGQVKSFKDKVESCPEMLGFFIGTLLEKSVRCRRAEILRYLLAQATAHKVAVNPSKLDTLLNAAAADGQLEMVESLLDAGADINKEEGPNGNFTPLSNSLGNGLAGYSPASREKYEKVFFYLISRGAKVSRPHRLLNSASTYGCVNVVKYLLDEVIDQYPVDAAGGADAYFGGGMSNNSALLWAVMGNHLDVVKLLLERGGAMGGNGEDGREALKAAEASKKTEIINALIEAGITPAEATEGAAGLDSETISAKTREIMKGLQDFSGQQPSAAALDVKPDDLNQLPYDMANFIAKMLSGEIFDDLKQQRDEWVADHIARGRCLDRETRPLKEVLGELENEFSKLDPRILQMFNPGLSCDEFNSLTNGEDWASGELADLYQWRNGCQNFAARDLFGHYFFSSLQDALKMRADMSDISAHYYLPIMDDCCGSWMEVDLRPDVDHNGLLYELYKTQQECPKIFPNLGAFFGAYLACVHQGAFRVVPKAGPNGEDLLVGDYQLIDATVTRYRLRLPGEIADTAVAAVAKDGEGDGISIRDYTVALPASL